MAPHSPAMSHIPHYGTPGFSALPPPSPAHRATASPSPAHRPGLATGPPHPSPLSLSLRRPHLPGQQGGPLSLPPSPLLRPAAAAAATPQDSPALSTAGSRSSNKIKCVFIGDGAVGKTSLIISYTTNGYPDEYVPTAIDTYHATVHVDGQPLTLELCDTPGQDDFDTLRPLVYPNSDVFLLCFSVVMPSTFQNVKEKWIPEIRAQSRKTPIVLIGTQSDLRHDAKTLVSLRNSKEVPVSEAEARKAAASLGCETYIESSSLTQKNLKEVFDSAIVEGLGHRHMKELKSAKNKKKKKCSIL